MLSQVLFSDREHYLELGTCSKPVIKNSKELRCITVTGKTVLFNIAHTMRLSKKGYCTLKYTNLWIMEWITKVRFTFQSLVTHFVCVTHWSENVLYNTSVSNTQRICVYDSFQLEILSLFALAAKIHTFTLEVIASSSTVAAFRLASVPAETHLRPLSGKT